MAFAAINSPDAGAYHKDLTVMCSFPLLQDTEAVGAGKLLGAGKDDFLLYGKDGKLAALLPSGGVVSTNLGVREGYDNLMALAMALSQ